MRCADLMQRKTGEKSAQIVILTISLTSRLKRKMFLLEAHMRANVSQSSVAGNILKSGVLGIGRMRCSMCCGLKEIIALVIMGEKLERIKAA